MKGNFQNTRVSIRNVLSASGTLEKGLDLCEAISYEKSVGAASCVHQKCPFRYWYDRQMISAEGNFQNTRVRLSEVNRGPRLLR